MEEDQTGTRQSNACSVSQAMGLAKQGLEQIHLTVVGEVSECSAGRGYKAVYFTIRDDDSVMPCLIWRSIYEKCGIDLNVGDLVQVKGKFSAYAARGSLQFSVSQLTKAGEGNLRMKVAALAKKLQAEGLMDASRKRSFTRLPKRIAVITSPHGKAIRDVMRTLRRRYPIGELLVFGVTVEGETAPANMIEALHQAQLVRPAPDVILLVRGGGSYEALMPYNDESLARAVAACTIPVVTGIGHEPDNSIADMVADLRCSTPGTAAENVSLSIDELRSKVNNATQMLDSAYLQRIDALRHRIGRLQDRPLWQDPHTLLGDYEQTLDLVCERLSHALPQALQQDRSNLQLLSQRLGQALPQLMVQQRHKLQSLEQSLHRSGPQLLSEQRQRLSSSQQALERAATTMLQPHEKQLALAAAQLDALSPLKTLSRGYSIAYAADGQRIVKNTADAAPGDELNVRVQDGTLNCTVNAVTPAAGLASDDAAAPGN